MQEKFTTLSGTQKAGKPHASVEFDESLYYALRSRNNCILQCRNSEKKGGKVVTRYLGMQKKGLLSVGVCNKDDLQDFLFYYAAV